MRVVEASAVVPLSPEDTWDLLIGDQMHRLVEMPEISVVAVEDFQVRPDGTARYVVANKAGRPRRGIQPTSLSTSVRTGRSTVSWTAPSAAYSTAPTTP
jgi:hypothetical protein